jgi:GNAT superfamily N-acetyltransferase
VRELCDQYTDEQKDGWLANRTPTGYLAGIERGEMYVLERDGEILGFTHAVPGELVALFVSPEVSRTGVGSRLLKHALGQAQDDAKSIVVLEATLNAVEFYAKFGFLPTGTREVRRGTAELSVVTMEKREI